MHPLSSESIEDYLRRAYGPQAALLSISEMGKVETREQGMKEFGYGKPLLLRFREGGQERQAVLSMLKGDEFGHQDWWDRAAILLFQYAASSALPRHAKPLGLGYLDEAGRLLPVASPREFFLVTEKVAGHDYWLDLERIRQGELRPEDEILTRALAAWAAEIHSVKRQAPDLYLRRVRQTLGDSECIFGLIDSYPHPWPEFPPERFAALEKRLIDWRWKLRRFTHRTAAIHGDFHPWNILVEDAAAGRFSVLDRSRGEWGDPADDVACLSANYLLFGLMASDPDRPRLDGPLLRLWNLFFETYLSLSDDAEILEVMAPQYVFRGLVIASPRWYPGHPPAVRRALLRFIENVLDTERFDWRAVNDYLA